MRMSESICQQIMNNKFYFLLIYIEFQFFLDPFLATKINRIYFQQITDSKDTTINHLFYLIGSYFQLRFRTPLSVYSQ